MKRLLFVASAGKDLPYQEPQDLAILVEVSARCPFFLLISNSSSLSESLAQLVVAAQKGIRGRWVLPFLRRRCEGAKMGMQVKLCHAHQWFFEHWWAVFEPAGGRRGKAVELESSMHLEEGEKQRTGVRDADCRLLESANLACIFSKALSSASLHLRVYQETFRPYHDGHC